MINPLSNQNGATLIEYGIMAVLIAAVCVAVVGILGQNTNALFTAAGS